jgi:histone H3/H4
VTREGDETETTEMAPISEMMRRSGLVVQEEIIAEGITDAKAEHTVAENESENDDSILCPAKPSHIEFGRSTVKAEDIVLMKKLGYFGENDDELIRFVGEETIPESKEDEIVVFKSFFRPGLRFPFMRLLVKF